MGAAWRGPPLPFLIMALQFCVAVAASPAAEEACGIGARIVAKDAHGGVQAVSLRRFDEGAGAWEVEALGGVVTTVPAGSISLDLGFPPPQLRRGTSSLEPHSRRIPSLTPGAAGAASAAYRVGTSEMLDASGHEANTILGVFATRRIEAG